MTSPPSPPTERRRRWRIAALLLVVVSLVSWWNWLRVLPHPVEEVHVNYDVSKLNPERLPSATKRLFDAVIEKTLAGSTAKDRQADLDTAQKVIQQGRNVTYVFQLDQFAQPFEKILDEGVPFLFVTVQKK